MLTLSKDTWHYRNFEVWQENSSSQRHRALRHGDRQADLCTYTRIALVYGPLHRARNWVSATDARLFTFAAIVIYLFFAGVIAVGSALSEEKAETWQIFVYPLLVFVAGAILLVLLATGAVVSDFVSQKYKMYKWNKEHEEKYGEKPDSQPNVVVEFLKAKKRKICPILDFTE